MFEVGFTEIILIFGIALLVLGPQRLPKLAADLGRWAGRARAMARQLRTQLEQEVNFDPLATGSSVASKPGHTTDHTIHTPPSPATAVDETARAAPVQPASQPVGAPPEAAAPTTMHPDASTPSGDTVASTAPAAPDTTPRQDGH